MENDQQLQIGWAPTGFARPIIVSEDLSDFFATANLGLVDNSHPHSSDNPYVQSGLDMLINHGISSPAILTPLFSIYADQNNLASLATVNQGKPPELWDRTYLGADEHMRESFAHTFEELTRTDQELDIMAGPHVDRRTRKVVPPFDPNNFRYASFQSIVSLNAANPRGEVVRKRVVRYQNGVRNIYESGPVQAPILTPELAAELADPQNLLTLREEQRFVSDILQRRREE